jgi:hypothetical protein
MDYWESGVFPRILHRRYIYRKLTRLYRFTIHFIEYFVFDLDPKKRSLGVLGNLAFLTLTGSSVALAVRLLKWV